MNMCLDDGLLQTYMDGELAPAQMETCAAHLAACATCAELAHEAEHEYALCATAFAPVLRVPAPTARLRLRLEDAIAGAQAPPRRIVESPVARLRAWAATFAASFAFKPRYVGAFASFLFAVALTITLTMLRPKPQLQTGDQLAQLEPAISAVPSNLKPDTNGLQSSTIKPPGSVSPVNKAAGITLRRSTAPQFINTKYTPRVSGGRNTDIAAGYQLPQTAPLLPDEKKYMTTIATLDAAIKTQGQGALPPSLRAEYERNLAVVDQAIIATRVAARRNPQDTDAKDFLRAAYQNKVDLLTTVADQTQFIAARD